MIKVLLILNLLCGFAAAVVFIVCTVKQKREKSVPCDTCAKLVQKGGGGVWKYRCVSGKYGHLTDGFDKPPTYCKYYQPRKQDEAEG